MMLTDLLKAQGEFFGLKAQRFIWLVAAAFLAWTLFQMMRFWWLVYRERSLYRSAIRQLRAIETDPE